MADYHFVHRYLLAVCIVNEFMDFDRVLRTLIGDGFEVTRFIGNKLICQLLLQSNSLLFFMQIERRVEVRMERNMEEKRKPG